MPLPSETSSTDPLHEREPLNDKLKRARKRAGLNQKQIAEAIGYTTSGAVSKVERGDRGLELEKLELWAEACGCVLELVPEHADDPEALEARVRQVADPHARALISMFLELVQHDRRHWSNFHYDFEAVLSRARSAAARERSS